MKRFFLTAAALTMFLTSEAQIEMPHLFSDGMVLQQKTQVPVWGKASANEEVTVSNSWNGEVKTAKADNAGYWKVTVSTPCYGGPYSLTIRGKNTVHINDVFIGEVWLASGQSNMEMPMEGWVDAPVKNGPADIASSANNEIRVFMVEKAMSFSEEDDFKGAWKAASPLNTPKFGATCYYFARKLNSELGIPVGIINTSWGGTPDESWIPLDYVGRLPEYKQKAALIESSRPLAYETKQWLLSHKEAFISDKNWETLECNDLKLKEKDFDDSKWQTSKVCRLWETDDRLRAFDGVVWFRKTVEIPAAAEGKDLTLSLGAIDDMDITYFNGVEVGRYMEDGHYQTERVYTVPKNLVKAGKAVIAVRILDTQGGGGMYSGESKLKLFVKGDEKQKIALDTDWKFLPVAEYFGGTFYLYDIDSQEYFRKKMLPVDLSEQTPACLYNAMVAPAAGYGIAGAIWYQGEANVGRAEEYLRSFPLMIDSWREKWHLYNLAQNDFPFYYVQIAPYNYGDGKSEEIRESQRLALSRVKNSGMAVTMDIGDNGNIHPADKLSVGERLANIALKNVYGKNVKFSGPLYKSQKTEGQKIILSFDFADGLKTKDGKNPTGFEICGKNGRYFPASAEIKGNVIEVFSPQVKNPVSVRYLWKNCVDDNQIFNDADLPASSFQSTE